MDKRNYEMITVVSTEAGEDIEQIKSDIEATLAKREAEITGFNNWGHQKLFHRTQSNRDNGHFLFHTFKAAPGAITQINADMRIHQTVVKSMISRQAG